MPYTPDVTVRSSDGEPRLLVEVKTLEDADETWARRFRRNILAHFPESGAAYFLLVLPDPLYLWRPGSEPEAEPDYRGSTRESLGRYYEYAEADTLGGRAFEFLVTSWLSDLVAFGRGPDDQDEALEWLSDSGLYDAIRTTSPRPRSKIILRSSARCFCPRSLTLQGTSRRGWTALERCRAPTVEGSP